MSETSDIRLTYTPTEFAALFGKSPSWGYRQLYAGRIVAITKFGRTMLPKSEVERVRGEAGRYLGAAAAVGDPDARD